MVYRILIPIIILIFTFNFITAWVFYASVIKHYPKLVRWIYNLINVSSLACIGVQVYAMASGNDSLSPDKYMVFFIYFYLLIFLPQLVYVLFLGLSKLLRDNAGVIQGIGSISAAFLFFTFLWGHFVTSKSFEIKPYTIVSEKLPEVFDNYRIVQFSDLHVGNFKNDTTTIRRLINKINNLNPDLILFTGDLVTYHSEEVLPYMQQLSALKAKQGVYAVLGNHDYSIYHRWKSDQAKENDFNNYKSLVGKLGWKLLNNESVRITKESSSFVLAGMENWGEPPYPTHGDLAGSLEYTTPDNNEFILLMSHNPEFWRHNIQNSREDIDLTLSGHTHAMQLKVSIAGREFSPAALIYPLWGGMHTDKNNTKMIVNEGIGNVFYPMRIGTTPEISLITLKSKP
ncbi:MAG: metallophosphoesterase [Bacteroidales bacterium]